MTLQELEKQFEPYRNDYGFVSDGKNNIEHNPLFHGFYVALLDRYGLLDTAERNKQAALLGTLVHRLYPGILRSAPWGEKNTNEHSHDNLKAMFWLSKRLAIPYAKDFLYHGRHHGWNWNEDEPNVKEKEGVYERWTGMIAQAQIADGETPTCFRQGWLNGELIIAAKTKRKHIETMTLPYFMCKTLRGYGKWSDLTVEYWRKKGFEKYPHGMGEVFMSWGTSWVKHPFVEHYWGVIDV